jgi:hypothetical protein
MVFVVTFADDPDRAALEAYGQWVVGSPWLTTVGADYGVHAGSYGGSAELTANAPDAAMDADIQTLLVNGLGDGSIPRPPGGDSSNAIYLIAYPSHTTVTRSMSGMTFTGCRDFGGYHDMVRRSGLAVAYAVVPSCAGFVMTLNPLENRQYVFSHELIEAATDADPARTPAYSLRDVGPWLVVGGAEVADLCELQSDIYRDGSNVAASVWSNVAAMMPSANPCLPSDPSQAYFNTSATPADTQLVMPGGSVTLQLRGWSNMPGVSWRLSARATGDFMPTLQLSTMTMQDGGTGTLQITVPASAPTFHQSVIYLYSQIGTRYFIWPIVVQT